MKRASALARRSAPRRLAGVGSRHRSGPRAVGAFCGPEGCVSCLSGRGSVSHRPGALTVARFNSATGRSCRRRGRRAGAVTALGRPPGRVDAAHDVERIGRRWRSIAPVSDPEEPCWQCGGALFHVKHRHGVGARSAERCRPPGPCRSSPGRVTSSCSPRASAFRRNSSQCGRRGSPLAGAQRGIDAQKPGTRWADGEK